MSELSADWVLPVDGPPIAGGRVRWEDGVIVEVGPGRAERHVADAAIVPGFVSVMVVPAKSSTTSVPARARRTTSSYAAQNWAKSIVSALLMFGTSSCRVPSGFARSIAKPMFTCAD